MMKVPLLVTLAITSTAFASLDPTDTNNWATATFHDTPHPPLSSPPGSPPEHGKAYIASHDTITWDNFGTNVMVVEHSEALNPPMWTPSHIGTNSWTHGHPRGFYRVRRTNNISIKAKWLRETSNDG
jgi:hypothetical protein